MSGQKARSHSALKAFPGRKSAEGVPLCAWCSNELRTQDGIPRRGNCRYCSEACRDEVYVRTSPSHARWKVEERDNEICCECGIDCAMVAKMLIRSGWYGGAGLFSDKGLVEEPWDSKALDHHERKARWTRANEWATAVGKALRSLLFDAGFTTDHAWEMDHIVPVSEGGGMCGLENLRTLCLPCHRRETAALRRRLANPAQLEIAV